MGSMDMMAGEVGGMKVDPSATRDVLKSPGVSAELKRRADRIAASMNSEQRGEFRSGEGTRGRNRAHAFVNTYDRHAKRTANVDPAIFQRHAR